MKNLLLACLLFVMSSFSPLVAQVRVSGTVTSASDGAPIPGATIMEKGNTSNGITSDFDGHFEITVPEDATLIVSFVGMTTLEVPVNGRNELTIEMVEQTESLEEVVVVAYGTSKKVSFTGSAATVKSEDIADVPVATVDQAISGKVSGVQISGATGQPGAANQIRIRGVGSLNSDNNPLIVIDGVPVATGDVGSFTSSSLNPLSTISTSDIENISVLKDAAAASIYGSRAANGVILITTKKGKKGTTTFRAKAETGWTDFAMPCSPLASPEETYEYKHESLVNYFTEYAGYSQADALTEADATMNSYFPQYDPNRPASDYNWEDELFRQGRTQNYEVSANGGTEKTRFYTSFSYFDSEGVAKGSEMDRYTVRLNLDHEANSLVSFGLNTGLSKVNQNTIPAQGYYYVNPFYATRAYLTQLVPIRDEDGNFTTIQGGEYPNLVADQGLTFQKDETWRSMNSAYAQLQITEGLSLKSTLGYDLMDINGRQYWSPASSDGQAYNGYAFENMYRRNQLTSSNLLQFNKSFNEVHQVDFLAGFEVEEINQRTISTDGQNFPNDFSTTLDVAAKPLSSYRNEDISRLNSVLSRLNYNYNNRYYVSLSYRRDGSSRLGESNRWGDFWSVSGSWRISEESFMEPANWISDWKIRASYGINGNLPTDWYGALALYEYGADYNSVPGSENVQIQNPDLRWERNKNLSVATEMNLFDFLTVELEYFNRTTSDLLQLVPISRITGFDNYWDNIGEMNNRGVEMNLQSVNFAKGGFVWTTNLNLYHYKNEITKLYNGEDIQDFPFILREGESYNSFYLRDWAGVNPETGRGQWYVIEDEKRVDADDDGEWDITENPALAAKRVVGNGDPDLSGALTNTIKYNGFDLSFMFAFKIGGESYFDPAWLMWDDGASLYLPVTKEMYDNRWQEPGDNATFPKAVATNPQNTHYNSDRRLHDASYLRLKNFTVGYTLPRSLSQRAKLNKMRVYASGVNLLTWAAYDEYDPETTVRGVGFANMNFPPLRTFTVGLELGF